MLVNCDNGMNEDVKSEMYCWDGVATSENGMSRANVVRVVLCLGSY